MATFYVLPPRSVLDSALGDVLARVLPGLPLPADTWDAIVNQLASAADWPSDIFLVTRDDLPDGEPVGEALAAGFGAEPGDRVIELGARAGVRQWAVGSVSGSAAAR